VRRLLLLTLLVAACGGDDDGARCTLRNELPTRGALADPGALPLPATCVPNGLGDALLGRWFVRDETELFRFHYPRYEEGCDGVPHLFASSEDHAADDDGTFFTFTDGTIYYQRRAFESPEGDFEFASVELTCMQPDGTLAGNWVTFSTDNGMSSGPLVGTRLGLKDAPAAGLELVGELGTSKANRPIPAYNVVVDGATAYVVGAGGFDVIDVNDKARPRAVAHLDGGFNDVRVFHRDEVTVAYLAPLDGDETTIVDLTSPLLPIVIGTLPYSHSIQIVDDAAAPRLYLADYSDRVPVYDLTSPRSPQFLGAAPVPADVSGIHDLTVDGALLYVNDTVSGCVALDTTPGLEQAIALASIPTSYSHASWAGTVGGRRVVLHGDEGLTGTPDGAAFMRILDGDPASPTFFQEIARYQSRREVGIHNIELHGDRAYVAHYQDGARILDLSDPTAPREVAHFNTWDPDTAPGAAFEGVVGMRLVDGFVYLADTERGLIILRETP
jgi:hypothetical protein